MMQVISPTEEKKVMHTLKEGGVIAYPTETSYGLGCDVFDALAVSRIFMMKQRPSGQSLIMLVKDIATAQEFAHIDEKALVFVQSCWPGPVTCVFKVKKKTALTGETCAIRMSSHPFVRALLESYPHPIFSTSLNLHGQASCYSYREFAKQFQEPMMMPELFVDAGTLPTVPPSLMIDMTKEIPIIIRTGDPGVHAHVQLLIQRIYGMV